MHWRTSCYLNLALLLSASELTAQILPPGATATPVATGYSFTEGPLSDGNGGILFTNLTFNNLNGSDIVRYDIAAGTHQIVVPNSGGANGLFLDLEGNVISMDGGTKQVSQRSPDNLNVITQVLASQFNRRAFNSPNDVVIDSTGGIYFTDPDYNGTNNQPESVYYIDPNGGLTRILTGFANAARPNGIALSLDEKTLYLALQAQGLILSYDVTSPGVVTNQQTFADFAGTGPDGMVVDRAGNLYGARQNNVSAWDPTGMKLFDLPMPQNPTNVTFGPDETTLYITAGTALYSVALNVPPAPSADFDGDGDVDGEDFIAWQRGDSPDPFSAGNLELWQDMYGSSSPQAANVAVPEPQAVGMLIGLALVSWPYTARRWPQESPTSHSAGCTTRH